MPIRPQLQGVQDTPDEFERAANDRIEAGFALLTDGGAIGIELMGFAAEMLLKSAYFRFIGFQGSDPITKQSLAQAKSDAASLSVVEAAEQYHSVAFWGELLVKRRRHQGRQLSVKTEQDLNKRVQSLHQNFCIDMRYHSIRGIQKTDVDDVFDAIMWIADQHENLWR